MMDGAPSERGRAMTHQPLNGAIRAPGQGRAGPQGTRPHYRPWFQRQPRLTLVVAVLLFATVTVVRFALGGDASVAVTMLYALPVSLVALAWGRRAGVGASLAALALIACWALVLGVGLSWLGWLARTVPLLLIGFLLGDAAQRLKQAGNERLQHEARELRHRQAIEINDGLVQGMAAAKWAFEAGRTEAGLAALEQTLDQGQRLVSELIRDATPHEPIQGRGSRPEDAGEA